MIFVDGHVHIYDCFDVGLLLDSAWKNFQAAAGMYAGSDQSVSYVLLITEGQAEGWFQGFLAELDKMNLHEKQIAGKWHGRDSGASKSVTVFNSETPAEKMHLVPGRQIVTSEKIEVLSLFCNIDIDDGMTVYATIDAVRQGGGIPVLPWGVGKWFGRRGEIIKRYLDDNSLDVLFVGDNGGRPKFWPTPTLFRVAEKKSVRVLPGSDPLPLADELQRVGSFGFYVNEKAPHTGSPVTYLKQALLSGEKSFMPYGRLQPNGNFFMNQIRLRFSS